MRTKVFLAACLVLASTRSAGAQTAEIQQKTNAALALTRAGALLVPGSEGIRSVSLSGLKNADALLEHVKVLTDLESLELARTDVSAAGLAKLAGLGKLQVLNLASTRVGDGGLKPLARLAGLTRLSLYGTRVGNAGLTHLKSLKGLQTVIVKGTGVTAAGARDLRKALPKVVIVGAP